jgi:hypothetical protein
MANKKTSEKKQMTSEEYISTGIWKDTLNWIISETQYSVLLEKGYTPPITSFKLTSNEPEEITGIPVGTDVTDIIFNDSNYIFLAISYDLKKVNEKGMKKILETAAFCKQNNLKFYCLTANLDDEIKQVREKNNIEFRFLSADPVTLKTMTRSNPGFMALLKGTIVAKYHYNELPVLNEKLLDNLSKNKLKIEEVQKQKKY